jgi:phage baseplate assembly protein W
MAINVNPSSSYFPIGLMLPFVNGNNGYFAQSFDTNTQIKQNIINFLNTRRGERRMFPEFGTKLYEILFEQIDVNTIDIIKNIISKEMQRWIPQVSIKNISIVDQNTGTTDNYKIGISIDYVINSTNANDNVSVNIQGVNI